MSVGMNQFKKCPFNRRKGGGFDWCIGLRCMAYIELKQGEEVVQICLKNHHQPPAYEKECMKIIRNVESEGNV